MNVRSGHFTRTRSETTRFLLRNYDKNVRYSVLLATPLEYRDGKGDGKGENGALRYTGETERMKRRALARIRHREGSLRPSDCLRPPKRSPILLPDHVSQELQHSLSFHHGRQGLHSE